MVLIIKAYDIKAYLIKANLISSDKIKSYVVISYDIESRQIRQICIIMTYQIKSDLIISYKIKSNQVMSDHITSSQVVSQSNYCIASNERHKSQIHYAHRINQSIPESVVNPGIARAISAMAFPSCCILATLATVITVLVLVVIIPSRTPPQRKSGLHMIPIATNEMTVERSGQCLMRWYLLPSHCESK